MQIGLGAEQSPLVLEGLDDVRVGLLHLAAGEVCDPIVEAAAVVDRVLQLDPVLLAETEVVLPERDRCMDQSGALIGGDEVREQDGVASRAVVGDVVEGGLVGDIRELLAREAGQDLDVLAQNLLDPVAGKNEHLVTRRGADLVVAAE